MKRLCGTLVIIAVIVIGCSAYMLQSNGMPGYTGSPGEATCSNCHGGGSSTASGITITAVPSFSLDQYLPDSTYQINVQVAAAGFSRYGFACEILDSLNGNAGLMLNAGSGVKFQNAFNGRRNAVHSAASTGSLVTFTFGWSAPSSGKVIVYATGNAVNGNNNTSGDFPIARRTLTLTAGSPPTPSVPPSPEDSTKKDVGIYEPTSDHSSLSVYPNPANGFTTLNYSLKRDAMVVAELVSIDGKTILTFVNEKETAGEHPKVVELTSVPAGVYFIRLSVDRRTSSQKLFSVR